ncbi:MAG: hypothetical protein IT452_16715 [Planctomycetia bacterium]|nr:hypothetical protein [Planctomycetia bacterium]
MAISVLNQIVSSGTNFALGLYLVRVLTTVQFGIYGIGFAIALFFVGLGNALFLTQMVVRMPDKLPEDRSHYAAQMLVCVLAGGFGFASLAAASILLGSLAWSAVAQHASLCFSITVGSLAYLLKDFFVRLAYCGRKESRALFVNVVLAASMTSLLLVLHLSAVPMTHERALWVFAASQSIAALLGLVVSALPLASVRLAAVSRAFQEAVAGGRWALGGVIVTWLQSQSYIYVTAAFLGPVGVGQINAARMLISPFSFLLPAIDQLALPRLAEARVRNQGRVSLEGARYAVAVLLLACVYVLPLLASLRWAIPLMVGAKYEHITLLVWVWCSVLLAQIVRSSASIALQASLEFRGLMLDNVLTAALTVILAAIFSRASGAFGAVLGLAAGEVALAILLWRRLLSEHSRAR